ncbi:MAG: HAD hydrolase-like protein [Deltaproteobacteria bacterium]|nr:HAD hydrolase-like protein [Deltaproteobacteria bacterium]
MPLSAVVAFDLDGTLVDSVVDLARALNAALVDVGLPTHPNETVRRFVGNGAEMLVTRAVGGADVDVADVLARFRAHYATDLVGSTLPFAGIDDVLVGLREHALLAVATNKPGVFARPLIEALLPGRFAAIVGPDDAGGLKPDRLVLQLVERLCAGTVCCFVGDSAVDTDTARAFGVPSIGVTWGLRPEEARAADVVVDRTADLLPAILRLLSARA